MYATVLEYTMKKIIFFLDYLKIAEHHQSCIKINIESLDIVVIHIEAGCLFQTQEYVPLVL